MSRAESTWSRQGVEKDCVTWPDGDRKRWIELFADEDPLAPRPWSRKSAYHAATVYTRYLKCARAAVHIPGG